MSYPISRECIKKELAEALTCHIQLLRHIEQIDSNAVEGLLFTMHRFGFILERIPNLLIQDDTEELHFAIFQYYNLLAELKRSLQLAYPQTQIYGTKLLDLLQPFPTHYEKEVNQWWEELTGLQVDETKQTMKL